MVDSLSTYTLYHSTQVAIYALEIARVMNLSEADQVRIFKAGLVHDVGMISMSSAAVTKAEAFTSQEIEALRLHPTIGGEIIGRIHNLRELAPLVHHHHERFDGTGYPDRLTGNEIPMGARIISLADSLDAMLTGRPNRAARTLEEVKVEIRSCAGKQFDPQLVRAFLQVARTKPEGFFCSSNQHADTDMLITTVGIGSGRVRNMLTGKKH